MRATVLTVMFLCVICITVAAQEAPQENVLTKIMTIDGNDLPDEFLLANPSNVAIAGNGDIVVADEQRLKIFSPDGMPKRIVGGPGQGPGEFSARRVTVNCSFTGYITVVQFQNEMFHVFDQEYAFVRTFRLQGRGIREQLKENEGWNEMYFNTAFSIAPEEQIFFIQGYTDTEQYNALITVDTEAGGYSVIKSYKNEGHFTTGSYSAVVSEYGFPAFGMLEYPYIAVSHPRHEAFEENGKYFYRMLAIDITNGTEKTVVHKYTPVAIPDSVIALRVEFAEKVPEQQRPLEEKKVAMLKDLRYYGSFQSIQTDGNFIFAKTYDKIPGKGHRYDVFDSGEMEYVASVYFQHTNFILQGGRAYRLVKPEDDFPRIEVYEVDPAVYGR